MFNKKNKKIAFDSKHFITLISYIILLILILIAFEIYNLEPRSFIIKNFKVIVNLLNRF